MDHLYYTLGSLQLFSQPAHRLSLEQTPLYGFEQVTQVSLVACRMNESSAILCDGLLEELFYRGLAIRRYWLDYAC